ncbi:MAG: nuclear transport factor 2 family protein [Nocardioides sp.]
MSQDDLHARLRRLELIELAKTATIAYATACDHKAVDELRTNVFTNDAVLHVPNRDFVGVDAVAEFYAHQFPEMGARRHFLTNQVAEVDDDERVHVESYFFFVSADDRSVIGWGQYRDIVVVGDEGPRIADKTIVLDVRTDLSTGWAMSPTSEGLP